MWCMWTAETLFAHIIIMKFSIHTNIGPAGVRAPVISKSDFLAV